MTLEIQDDIGLAVDYGREQLTPEIRRLIDLCNLDLYTGPLYLDSEGERVSYFDEGAKQFPFVSSCDAIREALEDIKDIEVEVSYDAETDESEFERVEGTRKEIIRGIVGKELLRYVL
jgi:hypothetical protein